jgi:hypothetical protein
MEVRAMGLIDKLGIDLCTMDDSGVIVKAFQCKGFEHDFGDDQLAQCVHSIDIFLKKGVKVKKYRMLINRVILNSEMRQQIEDAASAIVENKLAESAEILWLDRFCSYLDHLGRLWCGDAIERRYEALRATYVAAMDWNFYVEDVPVQLGDGRTIDEGPLPFLNDAITKWAEGAPSSRPMRRCFVISEFGFGKTSLLLTLFSKLRSEIAYPIFVPTTQLSRDAFANEKMFVANILDSLLQNDTDQVNEYTKGILREGLVGILRGTETSVLLLDGLDEHPICYRIDGISTLLQCMTHFNSYVVLTVRKEFWDERHGNFSAAMRMAKSFQRSLVLILGEWTRKQIEAYVTLADRDISPQESDRFGAFRSDVLSENWEGRFGDIPKRPLFLKLIMDDYRSGAAEIKTVSSLYEAYFRRKIENDLFKLGSQMDTGRPLSRAELDLNTVVDALLDLLTAVAGSMSSGINEDEGWCQLEPTIDEKSLLSIIESRDVRIGGIPEVITHSLIVPVGPRQTRNMTFRFAHASFQEWFTARHYLSDEYVRENLTQPHAVRRFIDELVTGS